MSSRGEADAKRKLWHYVVLVAFVCALGWMVKTREKQRPFRIDYATRPEIARPILDEVNTYAAQPARETKGVATKMATVR